MTIPFSSAPVTLRTNLADSAITRGVKSGEITSPLVNFDFCGPKVAHSGFKAMVRGGEFDAGELAIVTFLQAKAFGKPLVLMPVPIVGRFQHHCIAYSTEHGVLKPKDIEGRRVGVRSYAQTTGMWVRGLLQHEYGVDLDRVTWVCGEDAHVAEFRDPPNCVRIEEYGRSLAQMMLDGDVAAAILGNDMPDDARLQTLVPQPHVAAQRWYERTGVIPTNHMFVIDRSLSQTRPDVVREIYRMLVLSTKAAPEKALASFPSLGFEANRKTLELAIAWSFEQKMIPRLMSVDELFDETTGALS